MAKVEQWEQARNQYLKRQRELDLSNVSVEVRKLLKNNKADRVIQKSMTPDDLAGIFKEARGVEIVGKVDSKSMRHAQELKDANKAISNVIVNLKGRLAQLESTGRVATNEYELLQQKLSDLSKIKDLHADLTRGVKCQIAEPSKFKP